MDIMQAPPVSCHGRASGMGVLTGQGPWWQPLQLLLQLMGCAASGKSGECFCCGLQVGQQQLIGSGEIGFRCLVQGKWGDMFMSGRALAGCRCLSCSPAVITFTCIYHVFIHGYCSNPSFLTCFSVSKLMGHLFSWNIRARKGNEGGGLLLEKALFCGGHNHLWRVQSPMEVMDRSLNSFNE
jgi:hypothetical protein